MPFVDEGFVDSGFVAEFSSSSLTAADRYALLKSDASALRFLLWEITARTPDGDLVIGRFGEEGWTTEATEELPNTRFYRSVITGLNLAASLRSEGGLFGGVGVPTYATIEVFNYDGAWDSWDSYSVDELECRCLMVGFLRDGTKVTYTDALTEPVLLGVGIDRPAVGDIMKIFIRSRLGLLDHDAQPLTFSEPCPVWPGDGAEFIDLGDVYDLPTGSYTIEGWLWAGDNFAPSQTLLSKDTGATGYAMSFGSGGILQWIHREQANPTTATGALVFNQRWTHWAVRFNSAASTREILLDATVVATTSSVTGNHTNNAATFKLGTGAFVGKQSRIAIWSSVRTDAELRDNMYQLFHGGEAGLLANLVLNDNRGRTVTDRKTVPVEYPTALSVGMAWGTAGWIGQSLAGQARKLILGRVRDVDIVPRDPVKLIYESGIGPITEAGTVYSNANALSGASIASSDLARGLVTLVPGTAVGKLTQDVAGVIPWGYGLHFDGVDDVASCTTTCPAGSMTMTLLADTASSGNLGRALAGYRNGSAAGRRTLYFGSLGTNLLVFEVRNDAGTSYLCTFGGLPQDEIFHTAGVLDAVGLEILLYVNGWQVASAAVTGTFNTVLTAFAVGRLPDTALSFHDGLVDAVGIFSGALTPEEIRTLALRPLLASDVATYGLQDGWNLDGAATNVVGGRPALTVSGAVYEPSRAATIDLVLYLLVQAGIDFDTVDVDAACAYLRDVPGEAGWVVSGGSYLQAVNELLMGTGASLIEDGLIFKIDLFRPTTGTAAQTFTEYNITASSPFEGVTFGKTVWGVDVAHSRYWSEPMAKETVATFITTQPERYAFVTETWRIEPARDSRVLDSVPGAKVLTLYSPLQRERDASRLGDLLLPAYAGLHGGLSLSLDTEAGLALGAEVALLVTEEDGTVRFGGVTNWRIVDLRKEETNYGLVLRRVV